MSSPASPLHYLPSTPFAADPAMSDPDDEHARLLAFEAFLDTSRDAREQVVEMTAFKRLCARGIPDHPRHLRSLAYSLLLRVQPPQKGNWKGVSRTQRREYYSLVELYMKELERLPAPASTSSLDKTDKLLKTISKEVERAISRFPYLKTRATPSSSSPLSPPPSDAMPEQNGELSAAGPSSSSSSSDSDGIASGVEANSSRPARKRRKEKLLCRRAALKRLEMIAEAEYRRLAELRPSSRPPSRTTSQDEASIRQSISPPLSSASTSTNLSPRITLSSDLEAPILSRLEGKRPKPLQTPQLSLSLPGNDSIDSDGSSQTNSSPITLLSPKPIPPPGSVPFSSVSGHLLQPDTHAEVLVRLLYIFSKANPGIPIQGLVDILAILYSGYLEIDLIQMPKKKRRGSPDTAAPSSGRWAEEQTYWAFDALTKRLGSLMFDIPGDTKGTREDLPGCLVRLSQQLKWADEQLWTILQERGLSPSSPLYAYRWITTLFSQDIPPQVILPLWDFILAESLPEPGEGDSIADPLIDIGVAILIRCKRLLMGYGATVPGPNTKSRRGLWGDTDDKPLPEDRDINQDLQILRSPPLSQIGGVAGILETAHQLRTARLVEAMENMGKSKVSAASQWTARLGKVTDSDRAASLSKASSNFAASMISTWSSATKAVSSAHVRLPSGSMPSMPSMSSSISASSLWSRGEEQQEEWGETYTSLPSTPRRNGRGTLSPPMKGPPSMPGIGGSPLASRLVSDARSTPHQIQGRTNRTDSVTSSGSINSLQDRLASLTSSFTSPTARATPSAPSPSAMSTGPRRLILSGSARRSSFPVRGTPSPSGSGSSRSPSPTKGQRTSMPVPLSADHRTGLGIGRRGFPSVSEMGGSPRSTSPSPPTASNGTLSPPYSAYGKGREQANGHHSPGLYRTSSNTSIGLYRVLSGEATNGSLDPGLASGMSDAEERERGEEGGLYRINSRARSPLPQSQRDTYDDETPKGGQGEDEGEGEGEGVVQSPTAIPAPRIHAHPGAGVRGPRGPRPGGARMPSRPSSRMSVASSGGEQGMARGSSNVDG